MTRSACARAAPRRPPPAGSAAASGREQHAQLVVALERHARNGTARPRRRRAFPRPGDLEHCVGVRLERVARPRSVAPDLVDVVLDERICVSRSRLCSTTFSASSIDSSATRPGSSPIARSVARRMSSCARARISVGVGLARAMRSRRTCSAAWRASSMIRPASPRARRAAPVLARAPPRPRSWRPRPARGRRGCAPRAPHDLRTAGHAPHEEQREHDDERDRCPR